MINLQFFLLYLYVLLFKVYFYFVYIFDDVDVLDIFYFFYINFLPYFNKIFSFTFDLGLSKSEQEFISVNDLFDQLSRSEVYEENKLKKKFIKRVPRVLKRSLKVLLRNLDLSEVLLLGSTRIENGAYVIDGVKSIYFFLSLELNLKKMLGVNDSYDLQTVEFSRNLKKITSSLYYRKLKLNLLLKPNLTKDFNLSEDFFSYHLDFKSYIVNFFNDFVFYLLLMYLAFLLCFIRIWNSTFVNYNFYPLLYNLIKLNLNRFNKNDLTLFRHLGEFKFDKNNLYDLFFNIKFNFSKILRLSEFELFYFYFDKYSDNSYLYYFFQNKVFFYKKILYYFIIVIIFCFLYFSLDLVFFKNLLYNFYYNENNLDIILNFYNLFKIKLKLLICNIKLLFIYIKLKLLFI